MNNALLNMILLTALGVVAVIVDQIYFKVSRRRMKRTRRDRRTPGAGSIRPTTR
jgi:hypothetical protein